MPGVLNFPTNDQKIDHLDAGVAFITASRAWPKAFARKYVSHSLFRNHGLPNEHSYERFIAKPGEQFPQDMHLSDLSYAYLNDVVFKNVDLSRADLSHTDLTGAILRDTNLKNADLTNAVLEKAVFLNTDLTGADLDGADLSGADLHSAKGLKPEQIENCRIDDETVFPAYLKTKKEADFKISPRPV